MRLGLDIMGLDIFGLDILGLDILGTPRGCNMDTNPVGEPQSGTVSADNRTSFMDSSG